MKPNPHSTQSLKKFFKKYEGLTTHELAIIADRAVCTITDWKRKCEILETNCKKPTFKNSKPTPENWDNKEWFEQAYEKMGLHAIAILIGKPNNWKFVANRLKKYGIPRKSHEERTRSNNPCCDEGWLYYYYSDREDYLRWCRKNRIKPCNEGGQRLTLQECAELAGVSHQTIVNWLTLFKIKIRDLSESKLGQKKKITPELRRLSRDNFFEQYRSGMINIIIGPQRFSNGTRVDKEETLNKRFNKRIRSTSTHIKD